MPIFTGSGVAIVTPMKDNLDVNYDKLEELIEYHIAHGTDSIIIAGTTGESSTLTMEEHRQVIKAAVDFTKHRIPVVAGTGSNCTRTAIQLTQEAEEDGADGALIVTPYYNKATQACWLTMVRLLLRRSYPLFYTMCRAEPAVIFCRRR
jgi:4-hydroxy-tetrahydrodipicolinate synthase